ncbi:MAG: DUF4350 domain-containing protein [Lewinellaceae bacterium]|nr:DUF4350 domain-containing protein [Lewinellaceae bacterium]
MIALGAILVLAAVFYYSYNANKPRFVWRDSWNKHAYSEKSDQPYGTEAIHRLLNGYFPGKKLTDIKKGLVEELPKDSPGGSIYVFIGEGMYLDSLDLDHLFAFVAAGNTAFIASKTLPFELMADLPYVECNDWEWGDYAAIEEATVQMSMREPHALNPSKTSMHYADRNQVVPYTWHYIESYYFCDSMPSFPIGYLNDTLVNFTRCPYGKGRFMFHTNPIIFTNYSLLRAETQSYVEGVLSWFPEGDLYWDVASRVSEAVARRRNSSDWDKQKDEHLLSYILQQPALAWAWYLLAAMALAWLIFRAKRRQRIIPVLPQNENSSYEFISTIANLHFREKNYQGLCIQGMKLFLAQVRERYGMVVPVNPETNLPRVDDDYFRRLSTVSEVPEVQVRDIFTQHSATVRYQPTEEMMVDLHVAMEEFWKKAK